MKFQEIKNTHVSNLIILFEKGKYIAHSTKRENREPETLEEHIKLVEKYFLRLAEFNGLEAIIDVLIDKIITGLNADDSLKSFTKHLFYNSIIYHDYGKINHLFQQKDGINNFNEKIKIREHREGSNHSVLSAYLYLIHQFAQSDSLNLDDKNQTIADFITTCFSFPIYKHHSSYLSKIDSSISYANENIVYLKDFLNEFSIKITEEDADCFHELINDMELTLSHIYELKSDFDFLSLFALLKLNYSLLTASDYMATSDYMNDIKLETKEHFGLITGEMKKRLIANFDNNEKTPYNGELIRETNIYLKKNLDELQEKSNSNLNIIRQKMGAEVLMNIEKYKNEKVFYIEAPTGGGKTNMSMIAIRKMLELHSEINKVFYVFPFTTLITQTTMAIKDTFGLSDSEIAQLHSKASFQEKEYENEIDAKYGKEKRNQIDNLFVNYPFVLLTHIRFFDILKSNKKDVNYLLHRLANSIVIIDELQAYNPEHWDKIKYFIANYAELLNVRFVIMSATLPKIDEIKLSGYTPKSFVSLIPEAKKYLQNPNFADRVEIKTDLLDKTIEINALVEIVFQKSKQYSKNREDEYQGSVYTIIEFIFKKSASEFYTISAEINKTKFFDEIFVLSGTIIEPRRKYIIEYLKDNENRKKNILLITTQVVEAGVDIDMDLGFKNQSLIDSDEQLAGRINRNINKKNCELWLFKHDTPKSIYGEDLRYKATQKFDADFIKKILTEKTFEELYEKVFEQIEKDNDSAYKKGLTGYLDNFKRIDFKGIEQDFKLIDSENASIFVPLDISVKCYKEINNFSENELRFIEQNECFMLKDEVSGEKIWNLYSSLIENKEIDFSAKALNLKILNGIMSKFVFSIFIKKANDLQKYCKFNEETSDYKNYQYYKFEKEYIGGDKIYDLLSGINEKLLDKSFEFF